MHDLTAYLATPQMTTTSITRRARADDAAGHRLGTEARPVAARRSRHRAPGRRITATTAAATTARSTQIHAGNVDSADAGVGASPRHVAPRRHHRRCRVPQPPPGDQGIPIKQIKAIPLMVDGVLYLSVPNHAYAVDARTGQAVWHYYWKSDRSAIGNRGMGMYGELALFRDAGQSRRVARRRHGRRTLAQADRQRPPAVLLDAGARRHSRTTSSSAWAEMRSTCRRGWSHATRRPARSSGSGTRRRDSGEPGIETWPNEQTAANGGGMPWQPPDLRSRS